MWIRLCYDIDDVFDLLQTYASGIVSFQINFYMKLWDRINGD